MKKSTKRWLSALLALTMTASALPLEAGAAFWDWLTPPSQEVVDKAKEAAEARLKEMLGDLYESYKKAENLDFSKIMVDLTVKAEGLSEESSTITLSGGEFSKELILSSENNWTAVESVPLFSGKLDLKRNGEHEFPTVIDYHVSASAVEGFEEPAVQDFVLDFDWTQAEENWKPTAMATVTYTAKPVEEPPQEEPKTTSFTASIQWLDENVPLWLRPSVTVQLLADHEPYGEPLELNLLNNWSYTWSDLPVEKQSEIALLTEENSNKIDYKLKDIEVQGYTFEIENGTIRARLNQSLTVPHDAAILWQHGENEELPTEITLKIGETAKEIKDTESGRGDIWYEELGELPLLDDDGIVDYSKAVSVEEIENYKSTVLTFPWYSAGEEDAEQLKDWLLSLIPSEAEEELPTLENMPQTYAEGKELRWLTVVWNSYEAPQLPPQEETPQEPLELTVALDVLTIWNDRNSESLRPETVSYALAGENDAEQATGIVRVNKDSYVSYNPEVLSVKGTEEEILALKLTQSFLNMSYYDRELLLIPVPSTGVDVSSLSAMTAEQLKIWAAQPFDLSGGFRLLAIAVNSRQALGSLTISKDVRDLDGYDLRDNSKFTYQINLIYPDLSTERFSAEVGENKPLTLSDLPVGTLYTVLEEGRYGYINEDTDCLQSGVIKEGNNSLNFVNLKFNLIVRMDWDNARGWFEDDVRVYVDDNRYTLGMDNLWTVTDYAYGISELRYRDLAVRGLPEGYEEDYSIRWKNHVAIVTVSAEYKYEVEEDWKDTAEDDEYRVLAKVVWVGGDAEKRPSVNAQLYRDGKAYRDTATLTSSKNSLRDWRYVWEDVQGDEDNNWNVKVTKAPAGYSCEVTKVKDNYFIITCTWQDKKENVYTGA